MEKRELCQAVADKLCDMHMSVVSCREFLPGSYLADMKDLFNADPETDTVSNVHWGFDIDGYVQDGVITVIEGASTDEACKKLVKYAKEKNIRELHLLYKDDSNSYVELSYDDSGDEFYPGCEVMISEDGAAWSDFFNIYLNDWKIGI